MHLQFLEIATGGQIFSVSIAFFTAGILHNRYSGDAGDATVQGRVLHSRTCCTACLALNSRTSSNASAARYKTKNRSNAVATPLNRTAKRTKAASISCTDRKSVV